MCISYDRLLTITTDITNTVIERYESDGVVCPTKLRRELFTTAAVDNIDHNTSSCAPLVHMALSMVLQFQ